MADITSELMYELLKQVQDRLTKMDHKLDEVKNELQAIRVHSIALQHDTGNIYQTLTRQDTRFDRIENRLELNDAPTLSR
jgi:predicted nuclease with TOPRIM domain